ncbi:hypothetical protein BLNAU_22025 [Blattamonas nauphoetae]|uniref:Flavodoxin n=1 Tax=Blattamonas nauphoetae TaxID=2049346 RepID=A0ABQ9WU84_9EUKA|nr:hypothetical protein BLNAU_22025 [Blattamonas nauphoetae]
MNDDMMWFDHFLFKQRDFEMTETHRKRVLILVTSPSGTTENFARAIEKDLKSRTKDDIDIVFEKLTTTTDNKSLAGTYWTAMKGVFSKEATKIEPMTNSILDFDFVVFGGPVWAWDTPRFITLFLESLPLREFKGEWFLFSTAGSNFGKMEEGMEKAIGKKALEHGRSVSKDPNRDKTAAEFVSRILPHLGLTEAGEAPAPSGTAETATNAGETSEQPAAEPQTQNEESGLKTD